MTHILVLEDSPQFQLLIRNALGPRFQISAVATLAAAKLTLDEPVRVDLMILDVMLPDGTGFQFLGELKADLRFRHIPVIFLTSKGEVTDKVLGLSLGADDYLLKPFEPLELRARVESKLSKFEERAEREVQSLGMLRIDAAAYRAFQMDGARQTDLDLTPIEFKLLSHLVKNAGQALSRERLLEVCWGDAGAATDRTVDKHIWGLRKKLGEASHYIETVPTLGYRFSVKNRSEKS